MKGWNIKKLERRRSMTLGEKIFKLRTEQGLSQETFGEKLGVSVKCSASARIIF